MPPPSAAPGDRAHGGQHRPERTRLPAGYRNDEDAARADRVAARDIARGREVVAVRRPLGLRAVADEEPRLAVLHRREVDPLRTAARERELRSVGRDTRRRPRAARDDATKAAPI